jgi:hypothetical protein
MFYGCGKLLSCPLRYKNVFHGVAVETNEKRKANSEKQKLKSYRVLAHAEANNDYSR